MSLRDLNIEKCYETTGNKASLVDDFYNPVLNESKLYLRIAGFFSSTSLSIVSKGIQGLYNNGGKMKLLISPELSESDYSVIKERQYLKDTDSIFKDFYLDDSVINEHLKLFAWMLDNNMIEIKVVVDKNSKNSLFHQKVGIFFDDSDAISFSGSVNETANAWLNNIEEFKTFRSWDEGQKDYLMHDIKKFEDYWENRREDVALVYDIPDSIINKILEIKPKDISELNLIRSYKIQKNNQENDLKLFEHQQRAVNEWLANGKRLLFEMATGTGKTRTAIGCVLENLKENKNTIYIVSTPQNTLCRQWRDDIDSLGIKFDINKIVDGSNNKWKKDLEMAFIDVNIGKYKNAILFTSHDLTCKQFFINVVKENKGICDIVFICDEVHAMGATNLQKGLLNEYDYRIGLSATPTRMYDDHGTQLLQEYFGAKKFEFTIKDALRTINPKTGKPFLNQYIYIPKFIKLTEDELKKYNSFSKKIAFLLSQEDIDQDEIQSLNFKRSKIVKQAENKLEMLQIIIDELQRENKLVDCITFVDEEHLEDVMSIYSINKISKAKITQEESATKIIGNSQLTERQKIIKDFSEQHIQVLIGIKCLDEGIDIPRARIAILMASSTNPREYVQRIGRVIRYSPNKPVSIIYDMVVLTDNEQLNLKEAKRSLYIAENANNYSEVLREFIRNGVNVKCL